MFAGDFGEEEVRVVKREESGVSNPELKGVSTALLEKVNWLFINADWKKKLLVPVTVITDTHVSQILWQEQTP